MMASFQNFLKEGGPKEGGGGSVPSMWAQQMGITPEDKTVSISFDGQRIIIEKMESKQ